MNRIKTMSSVLLLLLVAFLMQKITQILYSVIVLKMVDGKRFMNDEEALKWINDTRELRILIGWFLVLIIIFLIHLLSSQKLFSVKTSPIGMMNSLLSVCVGFGVVLLTNGVLNVIGRIIGFETIDNPLEYTSLQGPLLILMFGLLTPIAEELLFRGFILGKLLESYSDVFAVIFQGLLFAFSHLGSIQGALMLPLGLLTGIAFVRTRSVISGIVIHGCFNLCNLYFSSNDVLSPNIGQYILLAVIGLFLCLIGTDKMIAKRVQ